MTETATPPLPLVSVILPAHNEADYIGACLAALLSSETGAYSAEVIVVANACTDSTVAIAQSFDAQAQNSGYGFQVIDTPTPGKLAALSLGDASAKGVIRVYLDADVLVSPPLIGQIAGALNSDAPLYASGTPQVVPAKNWLTRAFAGFWVGLPFVTHGTPGFGLFAVSAKGRARWQGFPDIISDDTFVRLNFAPSERLCLPASYSWPMVEGLANLVRVRRRQDEGVAQIADLYPELLANDDTPAVGLGSLLAAALQDPFGFAVYAFVKLAVKTRFASTDQPWARGR